MRDVLRRGGKALRDHAAHVVVRHDFVGAFLVERADLIVGGKLERRAARCCGGCARCSAGSLQPLAFLGGGNVARDHAAMRT